MINTMALGSVRPAGSDGPFEPYVLYLAHLVYAASAGERTQIKLVTGDLLDIDMPLDKFMTRQKLDNPDT